MIDGKEYFGIQGLVLLTSSFSVQLLKLLLLAPFHILWASWRKLEGYTVLALWLLSSGVLQQAAEAIGSLFSLSHWKPCPVLSPQYLMWEHLLRCPL